MSVICAGGVRSLAKRACLNEAEHLRLFHLDADLVHVRRHQATDLLAYFGAMLECLLESIAAKGGSQCN